VVGYGAKVCVARREFRPGIANADNRSAIE
jgi:hypothetical protein